VDGSAPATRGPWAGGHDLPITAIVCGVSRVECDGLTWPANRTDPHDATHLLLALPISIWANEILLSIVRSTSANVPLALSASRRTASQCHAEQLEQQAKDFLCLQLEMANIRVPLQSDFDRLTIPWFQYGQAVGGARGPGGRFKNHSGPGVGTAVTAVFCSVLIHTHPTWRTPPPQAAPQGRPDARCEPRKGASRTQGVNTNAGSAQRCVRASGRHTRWRCQSPWHQNPAAQLD
jgi:hypothetical protein